MSFDSIINNGIYFFPAWKHYGNQNLTINCDRCNKSNLQACIGHGDIDLCLSCVDQLTNNPIKIPIIMPPRFIPPPDIPPFGPPFGPLFGPPFFRK